jgi:hypothetical protein
MRFLSREAVTACLSSAAGGERWGWLGAPGRRASGGRHRRLDGAGMWLPPGVSFSTRMLVRAAPCSFTRCSSLSAGAGAAGGAGDEGASVQDIVHSMRGAIRRGRTASGTRRALPWRPPGALCGARDSMFDDAGASLAHVMSSNYNHRAPLSRCRASSQRARVWWPRRTSLALRPLPPGMLQMPASSPWLYPPCVGAAPRV